MAEIIKDTKKVTEYSEDYRSGGYSTRTVEAYYCGNCKREIVSSSVKFCNHCGSPLKGVRDEIEKRKRQQVRPYETAYNNILKFRSTFDKESLEYYYLTVALDRLHERITYM